MTDAERLKKLLDAVDEADRQELDILQAAASSTRSAYQKASTAANKKDWDVAKEGLREEIDRLWAAYMVQEERFDSRKAVLEYLNDGGYSVSQGKLYGDCKKGLLKLQADKSVLRSSVEAYIDNPASGLVRHADVGQSEEDRQLSGDKLKYEVSILKTKDEKEKFNFDKERGRYVERTDIDLMLCGRAAMFEAGLRHHYHTRVAEWVVLVGGDTSKAPELLAALLGGLDEQMDRFAKSDDIEIEFEVTVEGDEDESVSDECD